MPRPRTVDVQEPRTVSPLVVSDRLLTLAEDVHQAGFDITAEHLFYLALQVLEPPSELAS